ncbi:GlsB/YeaQ/YmgE family stress response membrane protein [Qipengyuania qiaonensis]|uniref:GlsB/YeaQ/YmgE family stress response membrane protein n=1 Tax=Qipengyuania qiaonensis TaxID=2867240 RepID=A0ABS7J3B3_9SPHN|nr:GlsB/YeaQ/YmgE family stress response membrane protein [Qipengyuania qiaonensis]MBX7481811.1 GlsB/YeaQ/YmgE family stress response membrane protein [Qipengyuania qiaonensis]
MGLLILIVVGGLLGWLATIILRIEDSRGILANALIGVLGSLVTGLVAGSGPIFGTVSGMALLSSVLGATILIGVFNLVRPRAYR